MLGSKALMKKLEAQYKEAKKDGRIVKTLQDGDGLRRVYKDTYFYHRSKNAVKDPVFGEYYGDPKAVQEVQAKDPTASIGGMI